MMLYGCLAWLSPFIWPFPWPASAWTTLHGRAAFPKAMMSPTSAASLAPIFLMSDIICSAYHFGGG